MKGKNIILPIVICIAVIIGVYAYKEYNRKPADLSMASAALYVDAKTLVTDYLADEAAANKKYLGKIIEVQGLVVHAEELNLIIGDATATNNVSCSFDSARFATAVLPATGTYIKVRGVCTGFLLDVELNRCVMVTK